MYDSWDNLHHITFIWNYSVGTVTHRFRHKLRNFKGLFGNLQVKCTLYLPINKTLFYWPIQNVSNRQTYKIKHLLCDQQKNWITEQRLSQSLLLNLPYSLPDHASEFGAAIDLSKFEYFPAGQWYSRLSLTKKTI